MLVNNGVETIYYFFWLYLIIRWDRIRFYFKLSFLNVIKFLLIYFFLMRAFNVAIVAVSTFTMSFIYFLQKLERKFMDHITPGNDCHLSVEEQTNISWMCTMCYILFYTISSLTSCLDIPITFYRWTKLQFDDSE